MVVMAVEVMPYRQLNNAKTNNMVMTMSCPLRIKSNEGEVFWEQKSPNSPLTHRPLLLEMGKESKESMQSLAIILVSDRLSSKVNITFLL